jgi:hypothetical protein
MTDRALSPFDAPQVLKKAYEEAYGALRTIDIHVPEDKNTIEVVRTILNATSASKINLPDNAEKIIIYHKNSNTVWFGNKSNLTVDDGKSAPMDKGDVLVMTVKSGNSSELYGISSSGNISVYAIGIYKG